MAIVSVNELWQQRDSQKATDNKVTNTRLFQVISDTVADGPVAIRTATDGTTAVPDIGAGHPEDGTIVKSVGPAKLKDEAGSRLIWIVPVKYETDDSEEEGGGGGDPDEPTERTDRTIKFGTERVTVVRERDGGGRMVVNSAGQPYAEGIEVDVSMTTMTISATVAWDKVDAPFINAWKDTVHGGGFVPVIGNANPKALIAGAGAKFPTFFGFKGYEVKLVDFGASTVLIGKDTSWKLNMKFLIWEWIDAYADVGFQEADEVEINFSAGLTAVYYENLRNIRGKNGEIFNRPVPLNGAGKAAPKEQANQLKWNVYLMHKSANLNPMFTALDLPNKLGGYRVQLP